MRILPIMVILFLTSCAVNRHNDVVNKESHPAEKFTLMQLQSVDDIVRRELADPEQDWAKSRNTRLKRYNSIRFYALINDNRHRYDIALKIGDENKAKELHKEYSAMMRAESNRLHYLDGHEDLRYAVLEYKEYVENGEVVLNDYRSALSDLKKLTQKQGKEQAYWILATYTAWSLFEKAGSEQDWINALAFMDVRLLDSSCAGDMHKELIASMRKTIDQ